MADKNLAKMRPRIKLIIMGLQILLPFVLYVALSRGSRSVEFLIGILFALSMLVLILMG